jgi:hypothetical protein
MPFSTRKRRTRLIALTLPLVLLSGCALAPGSNAPAAGATGTTSTPLPAAARRLPASAAARRIT